MRFAVAGQACRFFFFRDGPESVYADEVPKTFEWIQLAGIVLHHKSNQSTADSAKGKRQLIVRDRDDWPAVERAAIDRLLGWL